MADDAIGSVDDVRYEREMLEFRVDAFLREAGWTHTCSTPGSLWLWEREIEGRRVLTDKDTALAIQRHFDALGADEEADECGDDDSDESNEAHQ